MLFAKRELKDAMGRSLSQRFTDHIGRYIAASDDHPVDAPIPISIPACYAMIDKSTSQVDHTEKDCLKQTIQHVIGSYYTKTGQWLNQEQVALAAIWQDTNRQATVLKERFRHLAIPLTTLQNNNNTSLLQISLLAQALQVTQFNTANAHADSVEPSRCSEMLNLPLDETSMPELEEIGRKVRNDCEQAIIKRGINLEDTQVCWRLTLRYEGCDRTLVLNCMPIEMLREVFESRHLQKYGTTDENRTVIIDELVIEIKVADANTSETPKNSFYVDQWLSQWKRIGRSSAGFWSKQDDPIVQKKLSWIFCPVLADILAKLVLKQTSFTMPDFFLADHQKSVDEVATRN